MLSYEMLQARCTETYRSNSSCVCVGLKAKRKKKKITSYFHLCWGILQEVICNYLYACTHVHIHKSLKKLQSEGNTKWPSVEDISHFVEKAVCHYETLIITFITFIKNVFLFCFDLQFIVRSLEMIFGICPPPLLGKVGLSVTLLKEGGCSCQSNIQATCQ